MRGAGVVFLTVIGLLAGSSSLAQVSGQDGAARRLAAARLLPPAERDASLRRLAVELATANQSVAALQALSYVADPRELSGGLREIRSLSRTGNAFAVDPSATPVGGQGGSGFADFTSLMDLIQTTVVPDTWEALGGPSTMSPYPGGILVDGQGLVQDAEIDRTGMALDNLEVMLSAAGSDEADRVSVAGVDAWRLPTPHRCVSLLRLSQEVLRRRVSGQAIDPAIRNLAGLTRVQYLILDPDRRDIVLVGPVHGIESHQGWMRDRQTGQVTLRLEYFTAAAASIYSGQPFGCTIDPSQQSLAAASEVAEQVRRRAIPIGLAADAMRDAIGEQEVRVFGTAGDTPLGYLMVEADRHMKQLTLGLQPLPASVPNYLQIVTRHIDKGAPDGQLLRLWFTGSPLAVRTDEAGAIFEFGGRPLRLASETSLAVRDGNRAAAVGDFRIEEFVDEFNDHFSEIAALHPIYGALESVYASAAVAERLRRSSAASWLPGMLGPLLLDDASQGELPTPRKVASIATLHRVTYRGQRHSIVVASGGVMIDIRDTVEQTLHPYPTLVSIKDRLASGPEQERWWWNAE